jgi:DEAD/DEAH box helicase domain-containing protein
LQEARTTLVQFWDGLEHLPCERAAQSFACGNVNDPALVLRYWWPSGLANPALPPPPSPGFILFNDAEKQDEPHQHLLWRHWLQLFNIFQTLPGFILTTQLGLNARDYEGLTFSTGPRLSPGGLGATQAAAWAHVIASAMGSLADGLHDLMDAGLPPPDEVGYELEHAGDVVAEAELAWQQRKLVLLMPVHIGYAPIWEAHGWKTLIAQDDWRRQLADELVSRTDKESKPQEGQK